MKEKNKKEPRCRSAGQIFADFAQRALNRLQVMRPKKLEVSSDPRVSHKDPALPPNPECRQMARRRLGSLCCPLAATWIQIREPSWTRRPALPGWQPRKCARKNRTDPQREPGAPTHLLVILDLVIQDAPCGRLDERPGQGEPTGTDRGFLDLGNGLGDWREKSTGEPKLRATLSGLHTSTPPLDGS